MQDNCDQSHEQVQPDSGVLQLLTEKVTQILSISSDNSEGSEVWINLGGTVSGPAEVVESINTTEKRRRWRCRLAERWCATSNCINGKRKTDNKRSIKQVYLEKRDGWVDAVGSV